MQFHVIHAYLLLDFHFDWELRIKFVFCKIVIYLWMGFTVIGQFDVTTEQYGAIEDN